MQKWVRSWNKMFAYVLDTESVSLQSKCSWWRNTEVKLTLNVTNKHVHMKDPLGSVDMSLLPCSSRPQTCIKVTQSNQQRWTTAPSTTKGAYTSAFAGWPTGSGALHHRQKQTDRTREINKKRANNIWTRRKGFAHLLDFKITDSKAQR